MAWLNIGRDRSCRLLSTLPPAAYRVPAGNTEHAITPAQALNLFSDAGLSTDLGAAAGTFYCLKQTVLHSAIFVSHDRGPVCGAAIGQPAALEPVVPLWVTTRRKRSSFLLVHDIKRFETYFQISGRRSVRHPCQLLGQPHQARRPRVEHPPPPGTTSLCRPTPKGSPDGAVLLELSGARWKCSPHPRLGPEGRPQW